GATWGLGLMAAAVFMTTPRCGVDASRRTLAFRARSSATLPKRSVTVCNSCIGRAYACARNLNAWSASLCLPCSSNARYALRLTQINRQSTAAYKVAHNKLLHEFRPKRVLPQNQWHRYAIHREPHI